MSEQRITQEEFLEAFKEFFRPLCFYANGFVKDKDEAYDIVLNAFLKAWEAGTFSNQHKLKGFLYITVGNACRNAVRHTKVLRESESELSSVITHQWEEKDYLNKIIHTEFISLIWKEVEKLTEAQKRVFILAYSEGLSIREIAKKLNLAIGTVKLHKGDAVAFLRKAFGSNFKFGTVAK